MPKYKIDKKEAVEGVIEENLFSQPFMVEMFGTDIEYELDHDTSPDTDEARNPILKQHILVEIEASKQTIELIEASVDNFEASVKNWLKQYGLDSYFDSIYTSEGDVTISIDVPDQDDSWSPEKYAAKGLEVDGSYIPRVILGAIDRLKNAQDLPAGVMQEMVDKVVDEIRGAGETNLNESYVFVDFLEKLSDEVRKSIKGETIDYLKSHPSDNTGLGNTLSVIDTTIIQYSEDKIYAEYEHKMKVMKTLLDARAKAIKKEVHDAIDAGNKSPISYVITSAIRPKPSRAEDGKDLGKTTVSFYKWGVYQGEEEIDAKDLTHMVQLGQYELEGFDIRDEDIDKTFYAEESDIDDTNVDEDGYGVKRAYAIEEDKAKNGAPISNAKVDKAYEKVNALFQSTVEMYGNLRLRRDDHYSDLVELLENVEIGYYKESPDSDYQEELVSNSFTMTAKEAIDQLNSYYEYIMEDFPNKEIFKVTMSGNTEVNNYNKVSKPYKQDVYIIATTQSEAESEAKQIMAGTHPTQNGNKTINSVMIGNESFGIDGTKATVSSVNKYKDGGNIAADGKGLDSFYTERLEDIKDKMKDRPNKSVSTGKQDGYPEYKANFENALFNKYGVMIGDTDIEDNSIKEAFDKNENVDNLVNYLGEKHQITPVAAQGTAVEIKSPVKSKSATAKSYICIIKDRFGKEIGSYELDYADDDYVSTFLSAIGVKLKAGDTKEIVEA